MTVMRLLLRAVIIAILLSAGAWIQLVTLYTGAALYALIAGLGLLLACVFIVTRSRQRLALCGLTAALMSFGAAYLYLIGIPTVTFKINARAFPGHMVV